MPLRFFYITTIFALAITAFKIDCYGQVKTPKAASDTQAQTVLQSAAKDSVIYLDPKTGRPKTVTAIQPAKNAPRRKPDTIIYIDNGQPRPAPAANQGKTSRQIDTVIVLKKGKQKAVLQERTKKTDVIKVQRVPEFCSCMSINVKAPDTLHVDDYVNYSFVLKNNCKDHLWVSSSSFAFFVFNPDGTPVKVLRKLQYAKQFRYPAFVQVSPGEEYVFEFADDPFFQYELRPYWKYRFTFAYLNSSQKYKGAPGKTYLCREFKDKTIAIADKPRPRK